MIFPEDITKPNRPVIYDPEDNSITSEFEDGTVQSRVLHTRSRMTITLRWDVMDEENYNKLYDFIVNVAKFKANIFTWRDPFTGIEYEVRAWEFSKWENFVDKLWRGTLTLKEV